jgi:hypothetical protein
MTQQFLKEWGMDYTVNMLPAPHPIDREKNVEGQFHLVRSSDNKVISPKTVSDRYKMTCPSEMVEPISALLAEGWITPTRGMILGDGSHEILSFAIDGGMLPEKGKMVGDEWNFRLNLNNFHGGTGSLFGLLEGYRIVCTNGAVALTTKGSLKLRHVGKLQDNYKSATQLWNGIQEIIRTLGKRMQVWKDVPMNAKEAVSALYTLYGVEDPQNIPTRSANEIEFAIREFSNPSRGTYGANLYDFYNAITATNSHYRPAGSRESEERRLYSLYNPAGSRFKLEADAVALLDRLSGQ